MPDSRRSGKQRANLSAMPRRRSAIANNITPPSDVRPPPSNAAVICLRETAGNENGRRLSLIIANVVGAMARRMGLSNRIRRSISALRHARQPQIAPLMNKTG